MSVKTKNKPPRRLIRVAVAFSCDPVGGGAAVFADGVAVVEAVVGEEVVGEAVVGGRSALHPLVQQQDLHILFNMHSRVTTVCKVSTTRRGDGDGAAVVTS